MSEALVGLCVRCDELHPQYSAIKWICYCSWDCDAPVVAPRPTIVPDLPTLFTQAPSFPQSPDRLLNASLHSPPLPFSLSLF